jgi:hypothetical protein
MPKKQFRSTMQQQKAKQLRHLKDQKEFRLLHQSIHIILNRQTIFHE